MQPRKVLISKEQLAQFEQSALHARLVSYIETLNEAVAGIKLSTECSSSEVTETSATSPFCANEWYANLQGVAAVLGILDSVDQLVTDTPPQDNAGSRFGNPAFRSFYDKIQEVSHPQRLLIYNMFVLDSALTLIQCRMRLTGIRHCPGSPQIASPK